MPVGVLYYILPLSDSGRVMMNIRTMAEEELVYLFDWADSEGWQSEPIHIDCLYARQPDSFLGAYLDGRIIGMVMAVKQGSALGVISNFFILGEFRGLGYGKLLFGDALDFLEGRRIILDSVPDKQMMYERRGFKRAYRVGCYRFEAGSVTLSRRPMEVVTRIDLQQIVAFDAKAAGYDRSGYLRCMLDDDHITFRAIEKRGRLSSYGLCFAYDDGYKILLSSSNDINEAVAIFFALIEGVTPKTPIYLNASVAEEMILAIIELLKMRQVSETVRMIKDMRA